MASYYFQGHCYDTWDVAVEAFHKSFPVETGGVFVSGGVFHAHNYTFLNSVSHSEPNLVYTAKHGGNGITTGTHTVLLKTCDRPELLSSFAGVDILFLGVCVVVLALGFIAGQQR
jgi:hypothetical protein